MENINDVWYITSDKVKTISFTYDKVFQLVCAKEAMMRQAKPDIVVGIARGGIIPASMAAQRLGIPLNILNKSRGNDINWEHGSIPENKRILLIDDIVGSGETIIAVKTFLEKLNNKVITYSVFYDPERAKFIPDISDPAKGYIRFPWDIREVSPGSKAAYKSLGFLPPDQEEECFGLDMDGIIAPDMPIHWYSKRDRFETVMKLRDRLSPLINVPKVPLDKTVIVTGRSMPYYDKTRQWLDYCGFEGVPLYCRDEKIYPAGPEGAARFKADKITEIGVSRYFESELWQAVRIAECCPAIDIIWWGKHKKLRISGVSDYNYDWT